MKVDLSTRELLANPPPPLPPLLVGDPADGGVVIFLFPKVLVW